MEKAILISNSCEERQLDLNLIKEFLIKNNFSITFRMKEADLIILSTCAFSKSAENYSIRLVNEINKKKKPEAELVVCGCLPKINKERLQRVFNGVSFGPDELYKMNEIIDAKTKIGDIKFASNTLPGIHFKAGFLRKIFELIHANLFSNNPYNQFFIKITTGCLGNCSYCVHKRAIGDVESKPIEVLINEFREGLRRGYKQFYLASEDSGCFGRDIGTDLVELLEEIIKVKGDYKVAIGFIHPRWFIEMFPRLKKIFRSGRINFICLPVQSGSNRILKLMNRNYTVEDFKKCIKYLNKEFPSIILGTDVIIGFPGETEEDFKKTLELIDDLNFNYIATFEYSEMEGTKSCELPNKVPDYVKKHRHIKFTLKYLPQKIRFILDIRHPYAWIKYSFRDKF